MVALLVPVEATVSFAEMEDYCYGNLGWPAAHLAMATALLVVGAATGVRRQADAP